MANTLEKLVKQHGEDAIVDIVERYFERRERSKDRREENKAAIAAWKKSDEYRKFVASRGK